jgi:hypothetical protein
LGPAPPPLACMEQRPGHCQTRDGCRLASSGLSIVLAPAIASQKGRQAKNRCRGSSSQPAE